MHALSCISRYLNLSVGKWGLGKKCNLLGFMHVCVPCVLSDEVEVHCRISVNVTRLFFAWIVYHDNLFK